MTSWHGHCCGWEVQFCDKLTFWKEIESKCLLVHILLFMQFFFSWYQKFFLKCKTVTVSRETECSNFAKDSCRTVTRSHEPTQKYKHIQPYPILPATSTLAGMAAPWALTAYSIQNEGSGRKGHSPASESSYSVSTPDTHTWNGFFELGTYQPSQARTVPRDRPCFSPRCFPFLRA